MRSQFDASDWEDAPLARPFKQQPSAPAVPSPTPKPLKGPFRSVVLWEKHSTLKAYLFQTADAGEEDATEFWLPKSQIKSLQRQPAQEGGLPRCTVEAPEWLLEKHGL